MLKDFHAFSGFSVDDLVKAKQFYGATLGLEVEESPMGLNIKLDNGGHVFVYEKTDHQPATYTILNFSISDIDATVGDLQSNGVELENYPDMTGEDGIARGLAANRGPDIAWFKDPAGNILAVLQES